MSRLGGLGPETTSGERPRGHGPRRPVVERSQVVDAGGDRQPEHRRAVDDDLPLAVPKCKVEARSTPKAEDEPLESQGLRTRYF